MAILINNKIIFKVTWVHLKNIIKTIEMQYKLEIYNLILEGFKIKINWHNIICKVMALIESEIYVNRIDVFGFKKKKINT